MSNPEIDNYVQTDEVKFRRFLESLLNPEENGYVVTEAIRNEVRKLLRLKKVETA